MRELSAAIGLTFLLALGCAHGQDFQAARACNRLVDDVSRLSCYDAAFGVTNLLTAQQSGGVKKDAQAKFGDHGQIRPDTKADLPKSLNVKVQQVKSLPNGLYRLTLDNGQVWRTTQADWAIEFKTDDTVTISRMVLGGYEISLAGHNASVSARRIK